MSGLQDVLQLPGHYFATAFDFLFRPATFVQTYTENKSSYQRPSTFLVSSIAIAAGISAAAVTARDVVFGNGDATLTIACVAVLHGVMALACGLLAAWLLNESVGAPAILTSFCYTSVFYIVTFPLVVTSPPLSFRTGGWWLVGDLALQVLAVAYLLPTACRLSYVYGRRLLAFVSVAAALQLLAVVALTAALVPVFRADNRDGRQGERVHGDAYLDVTRLGSPLGGLTFPARDLRPTSAQLVGAGVGHAAEWFVLGNTDDMQRRIGAVKGVGTATNLVPGKRYYFRYVVQAGDRTSWGDTESFVTPYE